MTGNGVGVMEFAEEIAVPMEGELGPSFARSNDLQETFRLRWGRIHFQVFWGTEVNLKVLLKVYRSDGARAVSQRHRSLRRAVEPS